MLERPPRGEPILALRQTLRPPGVMECGSTGVLLVIRSGKTFWIAGKTVHQILQTEVQRLIRIAEVENGENYQQGWTAVGEEL